MHLTTKPTAALARRSRASRLPGLAVLVLSATLLAGCSLWNSIVGDDSDSKDAPYVERPVEQIYDDAWSKIEDHDWLEAAKQFDEVERQHPYSIWARRAMLMSAFCYYQANKYTDAISTADEYIELHPGSHEIAYAFYLKAMSLYDQITDVGRDQTNTEQALTALQDVVQRFPDTEYARDASLKVDLTLDHLAGKEMAVGRYYLMHGDYIGAINRFRTVVERYQRTSQIAEALERLTEAYYALGVYNEAQTAAAVLGANYPGSSWYKDSYDLLVSHNMQPKADKGSWISRAFIEPALAPMLATLRVRDLVLIEDVTLDFAPGLNVLTGETGAGKSILLDALGLAAGARAGGRSSVRPGAQQGSSIAIFDLPKGHAAVLLATENGIPGDSEIILRRVLSADSRTRGFINDEAVGVGLLRDLGGLLVEIHGQADDRGLFDSATHRRLLDAFGGLEGLAGETAERFAALERARLAEDAMRRAASANAGEADYLRHAVKELAQLGAEEGEEARLAAERTFLMNAGRIAEDVSAAVEAVAGDKGAEASLAAALKRLSRMNEEARRRASGAESALEQAFALAEEGRRELEALLSELDIDSRGLEAKEERLFTLRAVARKFAVTADALPRLLGEFQTKLDAIENSDEALKAVAQEVARARAVYRETALKLSAARKDAAAKLEAVVASELKPLKLGHARFRVAFEPLGDAANAQGLERIGFEVATVEGAGFGPLAKIASGGELARFSLALKVALADASAPAALVFDEVDRGVGGAVADAVGERLQRLAKSTQILLVTHSPQVAARGARHFRITRKGDATRVALLDESERMEEIACMLSGATVTDEARAAAKRLLAEAQEQVKKPARKRA